MLVVLLVRATRRREVPYPYAVALVASVLAVAALGVVMGAAPGASGRLWQLLMTG